LALRGDTAGVELWKDVARRMDEMERHASKPT
jgi:hypothetical protein